MNRCEHGEKITKFCITEHCHNKESGGCDYCMKRYHFHLTNTQVIPQSDIDALIQSVTVRPEIKYKSRTYQENLNQFFKTFKHILNTWIDNVINNTSEKLAYPLLKKYNCLTAYHRLKNRQYKKLSGKEIRAIFQLNTLKNVEQFEKQEEELYFAEVESIQKIVYFASNLINSFAKETSDCDYKISVNELNEQKIEEIYQNIQRENNLRKEKQTNQPIKTFKQPQVKQNSKQFNPSFIEKEIEKNVFGKNNTVKERENSLFKTNNPIKNESSKVMDFIDKKLQKQRQKSKEKEKQQQRQRSKVNEELSSSKLRKRKSSIDHHLQLKFTSYEEKNKEIEERKRKLLEMISSQPNAEESKYHSEKVQPSDRILNQLTTLDSSQVKALSNTNTLNYQSNQPGSRVDNIINNILPPLPPSSQKNETEEIFKKVIKIPVNVKNQPEEVQSPILKNRKKQQKKSQGKQTNGFSIGLHKVQNSSKSPIEKLKEVQNVEENQKQSKKTTIEDKDKIVIKITQQRSQKKQLDSAENTNNQKENDSVILGLNQKNSLLLFSQALTSQAERAITLLEASLKYAPNNLSAAEYLSYLLLEAKRPKECLEVCEDLLFQIEDKPEEFQMTLHLHNNKAAALNMLGRYSESIVILQKCLKYRRKDYFYKNLADAYFSLGINEKACLNYEKSLKLNNLSDETYFNLAVCQFIQEEYTSCLLNVESAIKINTEEQKYLQLQLECQKKLSVYK